MRLAAILFLKFLFTAMLINLFLPLVGRSAVPAATAVAMIITFVTVIPGDMYLLPRYGSILAAAGETAIDTVIIWGAPLVFMELAVSFTGALITALALGAAEYLFHHFVRRRIYLL